MNLASLIPRLAYIGALIFSALLLGRINDDRQLHVWALDAITEYSRGVSIGEAFGWGLLGCLSLGFMILDASRLSRLERGGRIKRRRWFRLFLR